MPITAIHITYTFRFIHRRRKLLPAHFYSKCGRRHLLYTENEKLPCVQRTYLMCNVIGIYLKFLKDYLLAYFLIAIIHFKI